jgi:hypothetical protein
MADESTRRLLKSFGIAVTNLEDALESDQAERARQAAHELREQMKAVVVLVERLAGRAEKAP